MSVGVALLAGGGGRRLGGVVKATIEVGGKTILARQLAVLEPLFSWGIIVASDPSPFVECSWKVVPDLREGGQGPLAGLEAALSSAPPSVEALLLVGCDLPFLQASLVAALRDATGARRKDAVIPRLEGREQPLLAGYARSVLESVKAALDAGDLSMKRMLARLDVEWWEEKMLRPFDPDLRSFLNVNTPDDRAAAELLAAGTTILRPRS